MDSDSIKQNDQQTEKSDAERLLIQAFDIENPFQQKIMDSIIQQKMITMTLNRGEKVSLECIDDINTFWIRQDYQPLPNLMNIYYGSKLQLKSINCNMNGIIYCGRQDINWNAMNVDIDWKVIQMNINNCEMIEDINMELIVIDEYPKDINISCQQNGTWTFINSKNTIKLEGNLNITIRDELDLGIATCKYDNMIIKKVEITSTDNNIF